MKTIHFSAKNQLDHAIYLPALQPVYTMPVVDSATQYNFPAGLSIDDFNLFKPGSKLFNIDAGLYSAGATKNHRNPPPCMVTQRARGAQQNTLIVGDSGGYQIATGKIVITPKKREEIYHWLTTYCDLSMTLDVPTGPMYKNKVGYRRSFNECLFETMGHLQAFDEFGASNEQFLNVLQGEGIHDCDVWYDSVKRYKSYGWAIAGGKANPLQLQLWRLVQLIEDGMFDRDETWIHFLGIADLKTAVLLTTIRDALRHRFPNCATEISYDTSTPFLLVSKLSAIKAFSLKPRRTAVIAEQINKEDWAGSSEPFPYTGSAISKLITKGDKVYRNWRKGTGITTEGYLMLQNHNVEAQIGAIDAIHKLLKSEISEADLRQLLPTYLLEARTAITDVLLEPTPKKARERIMERQTLRVLNNAYKKVPKFG